MKALLKFIAFTLVLLLSLQTIPTYATNNKIVFDICEHYFEELDDAKELLCDIYIRAINDWRIYNLGLIEFLEEEGYKSKAETVEEHDAFGCNTTEISRADFIRHYLDYMKANEELMENLLSTPLAMHWSLSARNRTGSPNLPSILKKMNT